PTCKLTPPPAFSASTTISMSPAQPPKPQQNNPLLLFPARHTNRLVSAGAECVGVTSIAGHFCIDDFKAVSPLPVVDPIAEVRSAIETRGLKRIGIIGTRTVMETRFYGRIASAEIVPPSEPDLDDVHQTYVAMAASGFVTEEQRSIFNAVSHRLLGEQ